MYGNADLKETIIFSEKKDKPTMYIQKKINNLKKLLLKYLN